MRNLTYINYKDIVLYTNYVKVGNGPPLLFLHGWGCDSSIFAPIISQLGSKFTCYAVDFAGFGKSDDPPEEGWTVIDYARQIKDFCDEQGLTYVTIVAHSFGCRVSMVLSARYGLAQRLFLVAPAGLKNRSVAKFVRVARFKMAKFLHKLHLIKCLPNVGSADYLACNDSMRRTFVKVVNQDLSRYAKRITVPTIIVNGDKDVQTPLKNARKLHKLIRNSNIAVIGGDHFALFYNPTAFSRAVCAFCEV